MVVRVPAATPQPGFPMRGGTIYVDHTVSFPRRRESHFTSAHKWNSEGRGWVGILGSGAKS